MLRRHVFRHLLLSAVLGTTLMLAGGGCRSCGSCYDYDPPVADSNGGGGRAGSASHCGACSPGDGPTGNCNCGNQGAPDAEYLENAPEPPEYEGDYQ